MNTLEQLLISRLQSGLVRRSVSRCSTWAESYRMMKNVNMIDGKAVTEIGLWNFKYFPWLKEMMDAEAQMIVGQKSAQMGFTEVALNRTFYKLDVESVDVLYVLPTKTPDASDFSASRFDPALELSDHLSRMFSDVKNIGHKRAGTKNLYVRGSRARAGLKSIPAGFIIFDEFDEMDQENVPLAMERTSGQFDKQFFMLSTPTIEDFGINVHYKRSTQEHFMFACPHCNRQTELIYPDCLVITAEDLMDQKISESYLKCKECNHKLEHTQKPLFLKNGIWVPSFTDRDARGFYINQLYSSTVTPPELAKSALKAQLNAADEQELYNSKLGLPHSVEGARVTDGQIQDCISGHKKYTVAPQFGVMVMGVDVGKWLHVEIDSYILPQRFSGTTDISIQCECHMVTELKVLNFEDLDRLMQQYAIQMCVIDANPERRKAYEFACRHWGRVKLCTYPEGINSRQITNRDEDSSIQVDRTSWLDVSLGRFRNKSIKLPIDTSTEYKEHIKAQVRVYSKDSVGNPIARYVTGNKEDHFGHARNYAEIALPLATSMAQPRTIRVN